MEDKIKNFQEFWPFYLHEHSRASTKMVHFVGTSIGLILMVYMIVSSQWWIFPIGLVGVYGVLFASHFIFEKNKPATLKNPYWSFLADLKMWFYILTGRIKIK